MGRLFKIDDVVETCTLDDVARSVMELVENENRNGECVVCANGYSNSSTDKPDDLAKS